MEKWIRARYQPNLPLNGDRRATASPEHITLSRQAAQEGMVLLKNRGDLLPLAPGSRVALFGKGSFDYVKGRKRRRNRLLCPQCLRRTESGKRAPL